MIIKFILSLVRGFRAMDLALLSIAHLHSQISPAWVILSGLYKGPKCVIYDW